MPIYVALLRAVNVGGTGKLPMAELKSMCEAEGFAQVQTYIASGKCGAGCRLHRAAAQVGIGATPGQLCG
jgi:L-amino acid N-acyltransferase YncA